MDPNTCYDEMIQAEKDGNWDAVAEHAENLSTWLARGGFEPDRPNWRAHLANASPLTRVSEYTFSDIGTFGGIPHVTVLAADGTEMQHSIPLDEAERDYGPDSKGTAT
jgi:hypothetical protein